MNRFRQKEDAVSPVIATILMVAITVVLAGVLVVYLQTLPSGGGTVETQLGIRIEKPSSDYVIYITNGNTKTTDLTLLVINTTSGAKTVNVLFSALPSADAVFNDNNANGKLDAGDSIQLLASGGNVASGYKVSFVRGDNTVAGPKELP